MRRRFATCVPKLFPSRSLRILHLSNTTHGRQTRTHVRTHTLVSGDAMHAGRRRAEPFGVQSRGSPSQRRPRRRTCILSANHLIFPEGIYRCRLQHDRVVHRDAKCHSQDDQLNILLSEKAGKRKQVGSERRHQERGD